MPEININDLAKELDGEDMIGFTRSFVRDIRSGLEEISSARYDWIDTLAKQDWSGVLALGMGGSAAGGDFLASLCSLQGKIPVVVQRDYVIPSWWNKSWLILATSHSGNTEEAIDATEIAVKSGAIAVVISTGGILSGLAEINENCHFIPSVGGQPPRSAFGHIFSRQLGLFRRLKILPELSNDEEMLARLQATIEEYDFINNENLDLIELCNIITTQPISLLGPTELQPALIRFKNQLNENSARFARVGVIPEMNHNEAWLGAVLEMTETPLLKKMLCYS